MATQLFTDILARSKNVPRATQTATEWLRDQAKSIRSIQQPQKVIAKGEERLTTNITIGRLYLFMYDAKTKEDLPYYDKFPLIFPFQKVKDGFYGINMHYLPHMLRAKLMDALYDLINNQTYDDTTKLRLSYQILKSAAKYRYFKPCIKHYLYSHVKSRFLWIPASQWDTALFLPLERFTSVQRGYIRKDKVWRDSRKMLGV